MNTKHRSAEQFLSNDKFRQLLRARNALRFRLSIAAFVCHFFFVGGIAFYRNFFAQPLYDGATITIGIVSAAVVIVAFIMLQLVYIVATHRRLDPLQQQVLKEVSADVE